MTTQAPPVVGALLGACLGAVPGARDLAFGTARPTAFGGAVDLVAAAAVPVGIINLGASVASKMSGKSGVSVPRGLVMSAVGLRLVLVPALSMALTLLLRRTTPLVPRDDPALALVLMLEAAPPSAMQTMIFCQLFAQPLERPLGQVLVAMYLGSLLTLTVAIALILSVLEAG